MKRTALLLAILTLSLAACGGQSDASKATLQPTAAATDAVAEGRNLRGVRYCEIFVITGALNQIKAGVYNTVGLNDCPAEKWKALDAEALKKQFKATAIIMNGPRYFLMDTNILKNPGGIASFDGLEMHLVANIQIPPGSLLGGAKRQPYTETTIERQTEYVFAKGRTVYELVSPEGHIYVMQSYAQIVDETLNEEALSKLVGRLSLPQKWQYRVRTLEADYTVRSVGEAHVIQDDFENTYQRVDN